MRPARHENMKAGAARLVRIGIIGNVYARGPRLVEKFENCCEPAGVTACNPEVRGMRRGPGSPPDLDRLAKRIQKAITEPGPLVGYVSKRQTELQPTPTRPTRPCPRNRRRSNRDRWTAQPLPARNESATRARMRLISSSVAGRSSNPITSARMQPCGTMAATLAEGATVEFGKEFGDVRPAPFTTESSAYPGPVKVHRLQVFGRKRRVANSIKADQVGCDPLMNLRNVIRLRERLQIGVTVNVDESRTNDATRGIDFADCLSLENADELNPIAADRNICSKPRRTGAIDDASIANHQVDTGQLSHPAVGGGTRSDTL